MIQSYIDEGKRKFVISSSGNAAISAAYKVRDDDGEATLRAFISPRIGPLKRIRLERAIGDSDRIVVVEFERPKQAAFQYARKSGAVFLRASQDDRALTGYETLARELIEQVKDCGAVFIPTSSGTLAQGLFEGIRNQESRIMDVAQLHIVQTSKTHPIASEFDSDFESNDLSLATAIVDNIAHRKNEVVKAVENSEGSGWVISDNELKHAAEMYQLCHSEFVSESRKQHDSGSRDLVSGMTGRSKIDELWDEPSYDSLLSLAGLMKALKKGWRFERPIVLLFTGK